MHAEQLLPRRLQRLTARMELLSTHDLPNVSLPARPKVVQQTMLARAGRYQVSLERRVAQLEKQHEVLVTSLSSRLDDLTARCEAVERSLDRPAQVHLRVCEEVERMTGRGSTTRFEGSPTNASCRARETISFRDLWHSFRTDDASGPEHDMTESNLQVPQSPVLSTISPVSSPLQLKRALTAWDGRPVSGWRSNQELEARGAALMVHLAELRQSNVAYQVTVIAARLPQARSHCIFAACLPQARSLCIFAAYLQRLNGQPLQPLSNLSRVGCGKFAARRCSCSNSGQAVPTSRTSVICCALRMWH